MQFLIQLWLPILVSAAGVFVLSSIVHMVLKHHAADLTKLPNEDAVMAALRNAGVGPGEYVMPRASSMKEMATPEMVAKLNAGPVAYLTVVPNGPMKLGPSLAKWFLYSVCISIVAGYLAWHAVGGAGASFAPVMRFAGTAAFAMYGVATVHDSIWKGLRWATTLRFLADGLAYALLTGAIFGWLWPGGI